MTVTTDHTISQLFLLANAGQRADIVNRLLSNVSHEMVVSLAASIGDFGEDQHPQVTPEQTEQITPAQVEEIAATAEQHAPGVVEKVTAFFNDELARA
ncbi:MULTISPECIES: hypothetical protein [unclassified Duganella]|jgi:hypothetical protein|uniref:hypothetical protein n=1 Tax=unclassified Duganella TaxID=2636909 RepID=UPI000884D0CE|nr:MULTISPECIES: hypothetical protein [unclassified Duganella]SDG38351.1 hypothetical protein SAMN05216320_104137 [Duganella sp. OV458]SDJ65371.1 hypothetical protein SAMN05428973_105267 [Duganella sp. OV510]